MFFSAAVLKNLKNSYWNTHKLSFSAKFNNRLHDGWFPGGFLKYFKAAIFEDLLQRRIVGKELENVTSKICGTQPLKHLKWYSMLKQIIILEIFYSLSSINFTWSILQYFIKHLWWSFLRKYFAKNLYHWCFVRVRLSFNQAASLSVIVFENFLIDNFCFDSFRQFLGRHQWWSPYSVF